jgi:diphthine synthase
MFYAIGLGLADEKDVSVKGLEIIKRAERVYLEAYTAVLLVEKEVLVRNLKFHLVAYPNMH